MRCCASGAGRNLLAIPRWEGFCEDEGEVLSPTMTSSPSLIDEKSASLYSCIECEAESRSGELLLTFFFLILSLSHRPHLSPQNMRSRCAFMKKTAIWCTRIYMLHRLGTVHGNHTASHSDTHTTLYCVFCAWVINGSVSTLLTTTTSLHYLPPFLFASFGNWFLVRDRKYEQ